MQALTPSINKAGQINTYRHGLHNLLNKNIDNTLGFSSNYILMKIN